MVDREKLSQEHEVLDALAVQLLALTARPLDDSLALSQLRWRLNHLLMVHLAKEDKLLYPLLKSSAFAASQLTASRFANEMGGLAQDYLAYTTRWTMAAVQADWGGFGAETRRIMRALRQRIQREERELYPLIAKDAA